MCLISRKADNPFAVHFIETFIIVCNHKEKSGNLKKLSLSFKTQTWLNCLLKVMHMSIPKSKHGNDIIVLTHWFAGPHDTQPSVLMYVGYTANMI